jgi:hypothetical protein
MVRGFLGRKIANGIRETLRIEEENRQREEADMLLMDLESTAEEERYKQYVQKEAARIRVEREERQRRREEERRREATLEAEEREREERRKEEEERIEKEKEERRRASAKLEEDLKLKLANDGLTGGINQRRGSSSEDCHNDIANVVNMSHNSGTSEQYNDGTRNESFSSMAGRNHHNESRNESFSGVSSHSRQGGQKGFGPSAGSHRIFAGTGRLIVGE